MSPDESFVDLAGRALGDLLERNPVAATWLGEHRHDDRLAALDPVSLADERRAVAGFLRELDAADAGGLSTPNAVDAAILRTAFLRREHELDVLRGHEWDPLEWNPGTGIYLLFSRDYAPLGDRLRAAAGRLAAVPEHLDLARRTLRDMPRVHVETAIGQFTGTRTLLGTVVERALADEPALRAEVEPVRDAAVEALDAHIAWLRERLESAGGDPRLGPEKFARKLAYALDSGATADEVLARAEADLVQVEQQIVELAARIDGGARPGAGTVRRVLDRLAEEGHVDNATIVGLCKDSLETATDFVRAREIVTVHDDPIDVIVMPEIHRGVAVAYCDPPGPLETRSLPMLFAISPTPEDWPDDRVRSFFREYNAHLLHNLTVHEAMPGHALQLAQSNRYRGDTPVRSALWSGPFVEGWAVYVEQVMADAGYRSAEGARDALRMQQLKMQLRMVINAILDARVHAHGMTEDEAMRLMLQRGYQEEGEAAGKWRRALLSSAQLSTYYVGSTEVGDVARDLSAAHPDWSMRARHDAMLAHGSPPARHLRALLGL